MPHFVKTIFNVVPIAIGIVLAISVRSQAVSTVQTNTPDDPPVNSPDQVNSTAPIQISLGDIPPPETSSTPRTSLLSTVVVSGITATVNTNFTGASLENNGFIPPSPNGAVGQNQIVELLNGSYTVYDKSTAQLKDSSTLNNFWQNAGVNVEGAFAYDPRILYDPSTGRWFASSEDNFKGLSSTGKPVGNNFLIAVSNDSNPLDGWKAYSIPSDPSSSTYTTSRWADFDTLGLNGSNVTLSANMLPITTASTTTTILTLNKSDLLNEVATPNSTMFQNNPNTGYSLQPAVDTSYGSGNQPLLSAYNTLQGYFRQANVLGTPNASTAATLSFNTPHNGFIQGTGYSEPLLARQPNGDNSIYTNDSRLSSTIIKQGNDLWGVRNVLDPKTGADALNWFELNATTNQVIQEGLIADPTGQQDYYFGSLAINSQGKLVIGFSCSGPALSISSCAVIGTTTGGVTSFNSPIILIQGTGNYNVTHGGTANRWGDYSSTVLDPSDPTGNTFWTFQEFVNGDNNWSTQISEIKVTPEPSSILGCLFTLGGLGVLSRIKIRNK